MAKRPSFVSGKGRLGYPHLTTPDTKFKASGEFKTKLAVSPISLAQSDIDRITTAHHANVEEGKTAIAEYNKTVSKATDKRKFVEGDLPFIVDEENDTVTFSFKLNAVGENKKKGETWQNKVALFDAMGRPCPVDIKIGSGTLAKISYELNPYPCKAKIGAGIQLRMKAAQILELVEWGTGNAASYGFGEEEGAFDVSQTTSETEEETTEEENEPTVKKDGSDF